MAPMLSFVLRDLSTDLFTELLHGLQLRGRYVFPLPHKFAWT